jgi:hypothetical protein
MSNFDPIFIILRFSKEDGKGIPNLLTGWADLGKLAEREGFTKNYLSQWKTSNVSLPLKR